MSIWVKICANTSFEDAMLAVEAGADAVGFVFAASPRQVSVAQVANITARLPDSIEKIGVFVDASFEEIEKAVRICGLTGVQIHSGGATDLAGRLRERFGAKLRIVRVLHFGSEEHPRIDADGAIDTVLVDSRTATAVGGTGTSYDWNAATPLFREAGVRLIAAGGLTPANVQEAIGKLRPWGVDVVSGVELSFGHKDPEKVKSFVRNARGDR
ncbi:MAG TPA: phosphoribosylanthranilate isomerase [Candidatus Acidoferrales bacterium]|jgi:phosphoribosylanthranilate isomerase|nr:phosphoribosylanthranilate isomerase [Candidatus Acidoferrales bacterium]